MFLNAFKSFQNKFDVSAFVLRVKMGANNALLIWCIFNDLLYLHCGLKHNEALLGSNFARNRTDQYA